jgi:hypothetical protein
MGMRRRHNLCTKSHVIHKEFLFDNCRRIIPSLRGYTDICKYSRQLRTALKHKLVLIIPEAPNHATFSSNHFACIHPPIIHAYGEQTPVVAINSTPTDGTADFPARTANSLSKVRDKSLAILPPCFFSLFLLLTDLPYLCV